MMATYYSGGSSEIQAAAAGGSGGGDSGSNLQTLYLMNPTFSSGYHPSSSSSSHDHQQQQQQIPTNMLLLNSHHDPSAASSSSYPSLAFTHQHQHQSHHHLVGIPLTSPSSHHHHHHTSITGGCGGGGGSSSTSDDPTHPSPSPTSGGVGGIHEIPPLHGFLPRVHYNLWTTTTTQQQQPSLDPSTHIPTAIAMTSPHDVIPSNSPIGFRRPSTPLTIHHQQHQQGGLSLSLNNNQNSPNNKTTATFPIPDHHHQHHLIPTGMPFITPHMGSTTATAMVPSSDSQTITNLVGGGVGNLAIGSKYLKAAQELLDQVVNVESDNNNNKQQLVVVESNLDQKGKLQIEGGETSCGVGVGGDGESNSSKRCQEISTAQRQELQIKKAKLLNMLDEVEQRYRQYHTQMQIVVTSFEQTAGIGSARSYTALALQTISKQFKCLKDTIASQIKSTSKSLGEDDGGGGGSNSKGGGGGGDGSTTRLRFVDHQLRQQRALQQLGMVQHNAWRPQRGLPERAVSVLRAWLFEHFLHPYPKDSDKHMLAKQTGLTRSQVSNWFINARVRLWKPMVEEMYLEEVKAQEQNGNNNRLVEQNNIIDNTAATINNNNDDSTSAAAINGRSTSTNPRPQVEKSTHIINHSTNPLHTTHDHHQHQQQQQQHHNNIPTMLQTHNTVHHQTHNTLQGFSLIGNSSSEMESILFRRSPKRQRSTDLHNNNNNSPNSIISMEMEMKPAGGGGGSDHHHPTRNDLFMNPVASSGGGFGVFPMGEIGSRFDPSEQQHQQLTPHHHRFMNGNGGVSLTLGLPHGENHHHHQLSSPHTHHLQHHNFIPTQNIHNMPGNGGRRVEHHHHQIHEMGTTDWQQQQQTQPPPSGSDDGTYDADLQSSRKRFAAQLLPDFVT